MSEHLETWSANFDDLVAMIGEVSKLNYQSIRFLKLRVDS